MTVKSQFFFCLAEIQSSEKVKLKYKLTVKTFIKEKQSKRFTTQVLWSVAQSHSCSPFQVAQTKDYQLPHSGLVLHRYRYHRYYYRRRILEM